MHFRAAHVDGAGRKARSRWRGLLGAAVLAAGAAMPAGAVITTVSDTGGVYAISLRVGSLSGVDTVAFSVTGNNVGLTPTAVTGSQTIDVSVTPIRPTTSSSTARPVTLKVDSLAGLPCQSGGCGSTIIPFSQISWVASNNGAATTGDIQNGRFNDTNNQQIASFNANATFCSFPLIIFCLGYTYQSNAMNATRMQFSYDNDVVYPAGNYKGTVRFTASME
ncbi:hypothetical protein J2W28_005313 [Variovorax boronicumulans]|uniref:hypothetical protein n=1 Tax=Variovorax boronicumulans TaxID=436515 RepID=UPI00278B94D1|nr:hypothetical protein [Variovorax boronicumulans]MDP9994885.1 hypothetical protein [Variovorax boronicumulans]MDQ0006143.1 hypothetical protein [Variovorax boronicumulans]